MVKNNCLLFYTGFRLRLFVTGWFIFFILPVEKVVKLNIQLRTG